MAPHARRRLGNRGEKIAARFLQKNGYRIVERQHRTPYGEIDLVCRDGGEWVFVEVKTRRTDTHGYPEASITRKKFQHIVRSAKRFLLDRRADAEAWRIDVIAIRFPDRNQPEVTHFEAVDTPYLY